MHYFTLGFAENPILSHYQDSFLVQLEDLWEKHIGSHSPGANFLFFPDVHSNLLAMTHMHSRRDSLKSTLILQYEDFQEQGGSFEKLNCIGDSQIELTDRFSNPYIETDSHPDHIRNGIHITFGEIPLADWNNLFSQTFDILRQVSPGFFEEVDFLLKKILPFGQTRGTHNSGSYSNVIGHITMSYPLDIDSPEIVLLEALIHEYNHNKINLILQSEKLLLNDYREIYYSPYRPDPRTIHGIYLGLHALSGAYWVIWKAYRDGLILLKEKDIKKGVLYVLKNSLSIQIIERHALMTTLGRQFLQEMREVHQETLSYIKSSFISRDILESSQHQMKLHYVETHRRYPNIFG